MSGAISVKFGMQREVHVEHNICEFGRNRLSSFKIWAVEIGGIFVHINNTLVLCMTFLAAQHTTMCLNLFTDISFNR